MWHFDNFLQPKKSGGILILVQQTCLLFGSESLSGFVVLLVIDNHFLDVYEEYSTYYDIWLVSDCLADVPAPALLVKPHRLIIIFRDLLSSPCPWLGFKCLILIKDYLSPLRLGGLVFRQLCGGSRSQVRQAWEPPLSLDHICSDVTLVGGVGTVFIFYGWEILMIKLQGTTGKITICYESIGCLQKRSSHTGQKGALSRDVFANLLISCALFKCNVLM